MRCPSCEKEFYPQPDDLHTYWADKHSESNFVVQFTIQQCPSCFETIVIRQLGPGQEIGSKLHLYQVNEESVVYPPVVEMIIPPEVPEEYRRDLLEAHAALQYSTKASAALSRRLLQKALREKLGIKKKDLSLEIDEFINSGSAPTYLTEAVDAIRHVGNFAAHPMKFTNTGEIVSVEAGEAEWLLEVLESLFDFIFVQPVRLEHRRESLNKKLRELGKPELKG